MHDFFKNIAIENTWIFEYGRQDYLNLHDIEEGKVHLMVEPITSDSSFSDAGNETLTYSGNLFLVKSSDVDEEYSDKYEQYIKPLFNDMRTVLTSAFTCSSTFELKAFKSTEVINLFDQNCDGLLINYTAKQLD